MKEKNKIYFTMNLPKDLETISLGSVSLVSNLTQNGFWTISYHVIHNLDSYNKLLEIIDCIKKIKKDIEKCNYNINKIKHEIEETEKLYKYADSKTYTIKVIIPEIKATLKNHLNSEKEKLRQEKLLVDCLSHKLKKKESVLENRVKQHNKVYHDRELLKEALTAGDDKFYTTGTVIIDMNLEAIGYNPVLGEYKNGQGYLNRNLLQYLHKEDWTNFSKLSEIHGKSRNYSFKLSSLEKLSER